MTRTTEWVLGVLGAISAFMGLIILFGGDGQSVGFGGDLTWQVGDISSGWGYGMLAGGVVLLAMATGFVVWERRHPHERARQGERAGLIAHVCVFVLVNGLLWAQDIAAGGGLEYAQWVTIPWGVGLVAHVAAFFSAGRKTMTPRPTG